MNTVKMAKPSAKDIAAAEELQQVLNAIDQNQRWGCAALEDTPDFFQLIDDDEFDPEQDRHAQALYNKLVTLMWENPSFHNRVISGMCHVIMYEKNEIIDPDSDCIDLHPRFAEMWNDLNRETQAARYWNKRYHQIVAERDDAQAELAAMKSQEPYGLWSEDRETMISEESAKAWPSETSWIRLYAKQVPAGKPDLVQAIFNSSDRKAVDRWKHCPKCDHKCDKPAVEVPEKSEMVREELSHASVYLYAYVESLEIALAAAPSHSQQSSQRISRKDVQEILESFSKWIDLDDYSSAITTWDATYEGRELLEKLNADGCPSHESEQHSFGESEFIPVDLLLKPDLTDEDVESWRKQNLETKVAAVDEVITMLRRRPLPNDPFIKSGFSEAIAAVVTMRNSMNQEMGVA